MRAVAERMGFNYQEKSNDISANYAHFSLFSHGHTHYTINFLHGEKNEVDVSIVDYSYTTGGISKSPGRGWQGMNIYSQTICIIKDPEFNLPNFTVRRENKLLHYLGKLFDRQSINFIEDKKFSSAFVLQSKNESEIRYLFNQRVRDTFVKLTGRNFNIECQGNSIIFHRGVIVKPEKIIMLLKDTFAVYNALKARDTDY